MLFRSGLVALKLHSGLSKYDIFIFQFVIILGYDRFPVAYTHTTLDDRVLAFCISLSVINSYNNILNLDFAHISLAFLTIVADTLIYRIPTSFSSSA